MLFLVNMLSKMKHDTTLGSRIAEVHNGSSLFTGDAGQGESNIRRWIIENDWLEAIVALPLNMFYNTGIATYIWVLTNRKPEHRKGKVQLIDATQWFKPLRKNLGKKNCELSDDDIAAHLRHLPRVRGDGAVEDLPQRGLRLLEGHRRAPAAPAQPAHASRPSSRCASPPVTRISAPRSTTSSATTLFEDFARCRAQRWKSGWPTWGEAKSEDERMTARPPSKGPAREEKEKAARREDWERDGRLVEVATALRHELGDELFEDHNVFRERLMPRSKKLGIKLGAADLKLILRTVSWRVETAPPVIAKVHKPGKAKADPLARLCSRRSPSGAARQRIVEYEPDSDLRDTEQVPLLEEGGIEAFIRREVLPYTPDAWIRGSHQDRLRGELHPALLQAAAAAHARRNQRRHPGPSSRKPRRLLDGSPHGSHQVQIHSKPTPTFVGPWCSRPSGLRLSINDDLCSSSAATNLCCGCTSIAVATTGISTLPPTADYINAYREYCDSDRRRKASHDRRPQAVSGIQGVGAAVARAGAERIGSRRDGQSTCFAKWIDAKRGH